MRRTTVLLVLAAIVAAAAAAWMRTSAFAPPQTIVNADVSAVAFRVQFGVTDTAPRTWDGTLSVSGGELISLRDWRPRPENRVDGNRWTLSTRQGPNFQRRPWEDELPTAPVPYLLAPGVIVDVRTTPATAATFNTANGSFTVRPADLKAAETAAFLNGNVAVDLVPAARLLSTADYQNDFAAIAPGEGSDVWVAWVAYRDKANEIFARRFDGARWDAAIKVTEKSSDIFLVKLARDGRGGLWAVWSAQVNGNWDLYARRWDGRAWSAVERLTDDPQPDIFHNVAADSSGAVWVAWQGFRNGKSDVFARRHDGGRWSPAESVSLAPGNDWEPAIAADRNGRVYVAWDSYDKGNYDVMMRSYAGGRWSEPVALANSQKFEAHVSLACDRDNRLWAVWNESGTQWGKDSGFLVKKEATRLYQWRTIGTAVYADGRLQEPTAEINASLPEDLREYNDMPVVQSDASGRMWVFFRHRTLRIRDVHNNTPAHRAAWEIWGTAYEGARWSRPTHFAFSQGRTDMRWGLASDGRGNLYAAWPTDNRDFEEFLFNRADVYAARVPTPVGSPVAPILRLRVIPELRVFPAHPDEPTDLKRIRDYRIDSGGTTYRIHRGDIHRHTEFSMDGNNDGTLLQTYRYALDAAELDFIGVSDHNGMGGPDIEYVNWLGQQMVDVLTLPNRFTPVYAYERSVGYPNGHRNILFARRGIPTLPIPPEEQKGVTGAKMLYDYLRKNQGIAISHTSATNMGTDWRDNDPEVEPLVEIYQGDRVSAEYEGAPRAAHRGNPASAPGGFRPAGYVWNAWAKGYKLGMQASSDHLSNHISYACTLATEFTREGLLDAMRKRHSYGATDNIILDYRMQTAGREYLQGDIVPVSGEFKLWVKVIGTAPIAQVDLVRNNTFVHTRHPLAQEVTFTFADTEPIAGESYYYVRVIQADGQMAWSSPIWVKR